jgi:uncharacterized protein with HEPN domain
MSSPPPLERLMHIRDEVLFLQRCCSTYELGTIIHDETLSRAVVRSLEIIGEATKNVPLAWRNAYPQVQWKSIAGIRDRMIHHYFDIDFEIVSAVLENDLDTLGKTVALMLSELPNN